MIHTILFDLDGTLLNTIDDLADAGNWVCAQNGWPTFTVDQYKHMVGNGIPKLVERFSPESCRTPARLAETLAQFTARYDAHKIDHYFAPGSFALVRGSRPGVPVKPDPAGVYSLLADLGADPKTTLFVGDSNVDIATGHNAGLPALGAVWGFRGADELRAAGADALVYKPGEILDYIRRANGILHG